MTFTTDFLTDFFDTTKFFDVIAIAEQARVPITQRLGIFKDYAETCPKEVKMVLDKNYTSNDRLEDPELNELLDHLENWFIQDMFEVTSISFAFAYHLCKGECPSRDCLDQRTIELNMKFNLILLQWGYEATLTNI